MSISTLLHHAVQVSFILLWVKSENNFILIDSACFLNCVCVWNVALFRHHFEMAIWSAAKLKEVLFSSSLICWNRSLLKQSKCWIVEIISKCNRIISTDYPTIRGGSGEVQWVWAGDSADSRTRSRSLLFVPCSGALVPSSGPATTTCQFCTCLFVDGISITYHSLRSRRIT